MGALNKVMLIGNLGANPEVRYTQGGKAVANFSIATNEKWTGKDGVAQEKTEWHKIVVWDKLAEICGKYLTKGKQVYIEGKLQTREWEKDGVRHWSTEIVASQMVMLGSNGEERPAADEPTPQPDIPF